MTMAKQRRGLLLLAFALIAAALAAFGGGYALSQRTVSDASLGTGDRPPGTLAAAADPTGVAGDPSAGPLSATSRPADAIPANGSGRFTVAAGTGARAGTAGRFVRYQVVVENEAGVTPDEFAAVVEATLADPRGWTAVGRWSFQRVPTGPVDMLVHLATPATTDRICGSHGVRTRGEVSCRGGRDVVINLKRWELAVTGYNGARDEYRTMVINHEVGHFVGHGHVTCPGAGKPAPVMQRQTFGLEGCARNAWPYPDGRTFVTGPTASD